MKENVVNKVSLDCFLEHFKKLNTVVQNENDDFTDEIDTSNVTELNTELNSVITVEEGVLQDPLDGLQDPLGGLQDPLLSEHYTSTIGRFIGSTVGVLQDPLDGLQDPVLFQNYASEGVLQDPLDCLQDPLLFKNYASEIEPSTGSPVVCSSWCSTGSPGWSTGSPVVKNYASEIGPSIGSPVGVLQDPLDGLQDPILFKNYASEIGPSIGSPVGVLQDPLDGLQNPLLFENYASKIGPSIGSPVLCL
ncbi:unnamed protein product [Mytilus coruscus]|uniref:Uncharacterized protein n=1 Tax=Mytilus coruscus TaxID=42192 RepID=A0A6J8E5E0_MYTCO|nr:unnamed protein product [Mytilus coruscus]